LKGKQLDRVAEGRAGGARRAGGGGFCESGGRRQLEWSWWLHGEKEAGLGRWLFGPAGRPRPRERGRWPAAGPGRRRQPKIGGEGSGPAKGQGLCGWAEN
jgi:hypothetical protein